MWKPLKQVKTKALPRLLKAYARAYMKLPWLIGDAINRCEDTHASKHIDIVGFSSAQLYDFARVAALWPEEKRLGYQLPWTYFRDAGSDLEIAESVLESALRNGYSRDQVRRIVRAIKRAMESPTMTDLMVPTEKA